MLAVPGRYCCAFAAAVSANNFNSKTDFTSPLIVVRLASFPWEVLLGYCANVMDADNMVITISNHFFKDIFSDFEVWVKVDLLNMDVPEVALRSSAILCDVLRFFVYI